MRISKYYFILSIVLVGALLLLYFLFFDEREEVYIDPNTYNEEVLVPKHIENRFAPPGYSHYWNTDYKISLFYKNSYKVNEYKNYENNSITIVFQNEETFEGFQIYIVPYFTDKITEEQFKKDVPSGIKKNEQGVLLDGVESVAFISEDSELGKTLEVWSIHYGFLYEILTQEGGEGLINDVVESWRFY